LTSGRIIKIGWHEELTLYARADQGRYFAGKEGRSERMIRKI